MKSFLIIGMGSLGHHLCEELIKNGSDVMVADIDAAAVEELPSGVVSAKVCDCTKPDVLKSFGAEEFDACFVCIENHFQSCLEITDRLKEMGAKMIYSAANRDIEEKFLLRNGADRIIYPERDVSVRVAGTVCAKNIFDRINLSSDYSIFEIEPLSRWIGKTVAELNFRSKYRLNIVASKKNDKITPVFNRDYTFKPEEHLLVIGHINDVKRVLK